MKENMKENMKKYINMDLGSMLLISYLFIFFFLVVFRFIIYRTAGIGEGNFRDIMQFIIASIPLTLFLFNIKRFSYKDYIPFFIIYISIIAIIIVSYLVNKDISIFLFRKNYGLIRVLRPDSAIYAFLFFSLVKNPKNIIRDLKIFALVEFLYLVVVELLPVLIRGYWIDIGPNGNLIHLTYSLSFGYAMVLPNIMFIYLAVKNSSKLYYALSFIAGYIIMTQGNRGSFLLVIGFILLYGISIAKEKKSAKEKTLVLISTLTIAVTIVIFFIIIYPNLVSLYNNIMHSNVEVSRNVKKVSEGALLESNGRKDIWLASLNAGLKNPIFGHGFFGDRPYIVNLHYAGYSHNIFLELFASFGIFGILASLFLVVASIRMIFFCKDREWRELFIILFIPTCQLLLSLSLWYVWVFWATLAVLYKYRSTTKTWLFMHKR